MTIEQVACYFGCAPCTPDDALFCTDETSDLKVFDNCDLVRRLQQRDSQAMVELYDRFGKLLYSVILRTVHNELTAEDLTQETFLKVWNRIHTFDDQRGNFEGWIVTVARNRALDYLRSSQTSPTSSATNLEDLERAGYFCSSENQADRLSKQRVLKEALNQLPSDQREVIELTHFEGMTQGEIATRLGKPLGTVKGMIRGALKKLRAAMSPATITGETVQ